MFKIALGMLSAAAVCWSIAAQAPQLPPNHPQMPQTPPGHPQVEPQLPAGHPQLPGAQPEGQAAQQPLPEPRPEDVQSIDSILKAYYESVSGEKGKPRDWNRLRSLTFPGLRFVTARPMDNNVAIPMELTVDQYVELNTKYFEKGGYFEKEIHRETNTYGNIAQVFSTYEARRDVREPRPYSRGINSMQMLFDGTRWWIVSILWDFERPDVNPLPAKYGGGPLTPAAPQE